MYQGPDPAPAPDGENDYDQAGTSVWGGDLDGDASGDVLVGAPTNDAGGYGLGASIWAGDLDADGWGDLLVGAPCDDSILPNGGDCAGAVHLVYGVSKR